jgi:putative glycosyltransferase (TIGR04372 family)
VIDKNSEKVFLKRVTRCILNMHLTKNILALWAMIFHVGAEGLVKILFKIFWNFSIVLGIPLAPFLVLICRLIRPVILIRFDIIVSERIGHFAGNIEQYVLERKAGINKPSQKTVDIWCLNYPIANRQLARMWRRVINIFPQFVVRPMLWINSLIPGGQVHVIGKNTSHDRDMYNLMDKYPASLSFSEAELERGREALVSLGVPDGAKFICLIVRDSAYLQNHLPWWNWGYHDFRNCNVQNYVRAAEELTRRGYYVIRMGAAVREPMQTENPMVIDYAAKGLRSDFMDIYLGAHCWFCISNSTGFDSIPAIFRRPILYVDEVPAGTFMTSSHRYLATTKQHWLVREERNMSLEEILASDAACYFKSELFQEAGIELKESDPEDIVSVVLEMEKLVTSDWRLMDSEKDADLQ